ncbi:hypothetical protein OG530_09665 [Streptomyces decoyicus]|uniref:hypothetical protein n=1 Tax=Streptomyces decoyicus TaxID=249567 RepID=UPI002E16F82E
MEQPTSGPEPEAPAQAAPGEPAPAGEPAPREPARPGEREGSGTEGAAEAAAAAGAVVAGLVEPGGGPAEPDGHARPDATAEPGGPTGPQPIGVGTTPTGQAVVDTALRRLADADHLPASGHLRVYEDVHRGLRDVLAGLDQHPGPPAPSSTFSTPHDNRS